MARHDRKGRSKMAGRFAALPHDVLNSPGYLATTPPARAVLVELIRLHNGSNNGALGFGVREAAARCHISKATASRALQELEDCGLVETVSKGSFRERRRLASTYRLLWLRCDLTHVVPTRRYREER